MSGPICPDCGSFDIKDLDKGRQKCGFCGWEGPGRGRKILSPEGFEHYHKIHEENQKLRDEGKLFFLRIFLSPKAKDDVTDVILESLESNPDSSLRGVGGSKREYDESKPYFLVKYHKKPSEELIEKLMNIEGVVDVKVF
ncbi:hypothetical protein ACFLZN_01140 [Nanoarchaeota archaeon]